MQKIYSDKLSSYLHLTITLRSYHSKITMKQIIIGVKEYPSFVFIVNSTQIAGEFAHIYRLLFDYIKHNMNFTYKKIKDTGEVSRCDVNGRCTGLLKDLQLGEFHFADIFSDVQLFNLPENITIGPVATEQDCSIFYAPEVVNSFEYNGSIKCVQEIGWTFWSLFGISFLVISYLLSEIKPHLSFINWLFILHEQTARQVFNSVPGRRIHRTCVFLFLIFTMASGSFWSATFQNGLVVSPSFIHIDTIRDIIDNNFTTSLSKGSCQQVLLAELSSDSTRVNMIPAFNPKYIAEILSTHQHAMIGNLNYVKLIRNIFCSLKSNKDRINTIYSSFKPIFNAKGLILANSQIPRSVTNRIIHVSYASLETSYLMNPKVTRFQSEVLLKRKINPACEMPFKVERKSSVDPVDLEYAESTFFVLLCLHALSIVLFVFKDLQLTLPYF